MTIKKLYMETTSYIIIVIYMIIILPLGLFPCFFSGFLTYEIIISFSTCFKNFIKINQARWMAVILIMLIIITFITTGIISFTSFFKYDTNHENLSIEINRVFSNIKKSMPDCLPVFLPNTIEELKEQAFSWIESNLILIRNMGHTILHGCVTSFLGIILGILIACTTPNNHNIHCTYFVKQLLLRINNLSQAFRNIVFAQIKISSANTFLTSIMIFIILPLFGKSLPFSKTLIAITFIVGLLPIVGNLISNIMITISAISISFSVGTIMFIYLVLIHKLEYFLNAEIIGNKINANPWELILSMLLLESIFGIKGIIAAPIFYSYLKIELRLNKLI